MLDLSPPATYEQQSTRMYELEVGVGEREEGRHLEIAWLATATALLWIHVGMLYVSRYPGR